MPTQVIITPRTAIGGRSVRIATAMSLSLLLLAGCDKKPGGQVAAVVNSEEITQQELRTEAEASGVQPGQDFQSYAPAMLDRVIQRNLLAGYAKDKNLDRGPDFVARRRQMEQALLANMAMRQIVTSLGAPSPADVKGFIQNNPALFAGRVRLTLDQVRFPAPTDVKQIKALAALGSIDAVLAKLRADNVPAARGTPTLDTGTLESGVARQIVALPNGQLFDLTMNGVTFISAITGRTPAAAPSSSWSGPAAAAFQRERAQKALAEAMAKMRAGAKIQYDPAFKPATTGK